MQINNLRIEHGLCHLTTVGLPFIGKDKIEKKDLV